MDTLKVGESLTGESIVAKWKGKRKNIAGLKRDLEALRNKGVDLEEVDSLVEAYQDIVREDYSDAEEFQEEKDDAWEAILDSID